MPFDNFKNFAASSVAIAPAPAISGTTLQVRGGDGTTRFPDPPFNATCWPSFGFPTGDNAEIVRVTAIDDDTFTIEREQEDSAAQAIGAGWQIALTITAKTVTDLIAATGGGGSISYSDLADVGAALASPSSGDQPFWNATAAKWDARPLQVFFVDDFLRNAGVVPASATPAQNAAAIQTAYAAAVTTGGIIRFAARTYTVDSGSAALITMNTAQTKWVIFQGAGQRATTIKGTTNTTTFVQATSSTNSVVYQYLGMEDFTWDCDFKSPQSNTQGTLVHASCHCSFNDFYCRRVSGINGNNLLMSGTERRWINITLRATAPTEGPFTANRIDVAGCDFTGGNYAVLIQALASGSGGVIPIAQRGYFANVTIDEIWLRDNVHRASGTPTNQYSACSFMVGGNAVCGRVRVKNCASLGGTSDDGFEFDSVYDLVVEDCYVENGSQEGYYFLNLGGMPNADQQRIVVRNCVHALTRSDYSGARRNSFRANAKLGTRFGTLIFENCKAIGTNGYGYGGMVITVPFRELVIRNYEATFESIPTTFASTTADTKPITVGPPYGRGKITIDGVLAKTSRVITATGTNTIHFYVVTLDAPADYLLDIRGIRAELDDSIVSGTVATVELTAVRLASQALEGGATNLTDTFANDANLTLNHYIADAGGADVAADATGIVASTNLQAEKRLRWFQPISAPVDTNAVGPVTDACVWLQGTAPNSLQGFKLGMSPKALVPSHSADPDGVNTAADTYLDCYVCDDGTGSFLCLDKVVAGTRTSLLTSGTSAIDTSALTTAGFDATRYASAGIPITRLTAGQTIAVRGTIQGNVVTAEYFSGGTVSATNRNTPGTNVATATLAGTDAVALGAPRQGYPMIVWVPVDANGHLLSANTLRMMVVRGRIDGTVLRSPRIPLSAAYVLNCMADSKTLRVGQLDLGMDYSGVANYTGSETTGLDATQLPAVRYLPGSVLGDGTRLENYVHPSMAKGSVAGGNTGTAKTIDVGRSAYWLATYTLTGNVTFTLANVPPGGTIDLLLTQDGTGSRTVAFTPPAGGSVKYAGGALGMTAVAGSVDMVTLTTLNGLDFLISAIHDIK